MASGGRRADHRCYFLLTVVAPLLVLLYTSLLKFYAPPSKDTFEHMTFDNYRAAGAHPDAITALKNSLILGLASATLVMAFMAVAAWIVVRSQHTAGERCWTGWRSCRWSFPGW